MRYRKRRRLRLPVKQTIRNCSCFLLPGENRPAQRGAAIQSIAQKLILEVSRPDCPEHAKGPAPDLFSRPRFKRIVFQKDRVSSFTNSLPK